MRSLLLEGNPQYAKLLKEFNKGLSKQASARLCHVTAQAWTGESRMHKSPRSGETWHAHHCGVSHHSGNCSTCGSTHDQICLRRTVLFATYSVGRT